MLVVEPVHNEDLPQVQELARHALQALGGDWALGQITDQESLLVAREVAANEVRGFALGKREAPCVGHILAVAVDRTHRGEGIGSALLQHVARELARKGALQLELECRADDVRARAFYERHGFHPLGLQPHAYVDGGDAVRLARPV